MKDNRLCVQYSRLDGGDNRLDVLCNWIQHEDNPLQSEVNEKRLNVNQLHG